MSASTTTAPIGVRTTATTADVPTTATTADVPTTAEVRTAARDSGPGVTVWLTGLSGSGKTTIATALAARVRVRGRPVELLDGDELRDHLSPGLGYTRADRDAHVTRVGYLARLLARNGVLVLVPVIAPYADTRDAVGAEHGAEGTAYLQIHVATPLATCAARDVKGLYAAHAAGRISHLTGVDDPYEVPAHPDLVIDTTDVDVEAAVETILTLLTERGLA